MNEQPLMPSGSNFILSIPYEENGPGQPRYRFNLSFNAANPNGPEIPTAVIEKIKTTVILNTCEYWTEQDEPEDPLVICMRFDSFEAAQQAYTDLLILLDPRIAKQFWGNIPQDLNDSDDGLL